MPVAGGAGTAGRQTAPAAEGSPMLGGSARKRPVLSPTMRGNPLLTLGKWSGMVLPLVATTVCFMLAALHAPSEHQILARMELSAEKQPLLHPARREFRPNLDGDRGRQALQDYITHAKAVVVRLQDQTLSRDAQSNPAAKRELVKMLHLASTELTAVEAQLRQAKGGRGAETRARGSPSQLLAQRTQKLQQLQALALSDDIHISMPTSNGFRWEQVWGDQGWRRKLVDAAPRRRAQRAGQQVHATPQLAHAQQLLTNDPNPLEGPGSREDTGGMKVQWADDHNHAYDDDVPGSGSSPPYAGNPEGSPGGVVPYRDETEPINREKYYSAHVMGQGIKHHSPFNPRTHLLDQPMTEESDLGLLDGRAHRVKYTGEDGQQHDLVEPARISSVHKGKRLLCLKDCNSKKGTHLTPVGVDHIPGRDRWTFLNEHQKKILAKAEAEEDGEEGEGGDEPLTDVEERTATIHKMLKNLREGTTKRISEGAEAELDSLEEAHGKALAALETAKQVADDQQEAAGVEEDIKDLTAQYNAALVALDLAQKDDFSYLAKLVPGGGLGNLEKFYLSEDPLLLASIRRGDFQGSPGDKMEPYTDVNGNPVNKDSLQKIKDKTAKTIDEDEKTVKRLFKALPYFPSHMMGDDKDEAKDSDPPVAIPTNPMDRLCLLCEALSDDDRLDSIPACAGMSCQAGAWRDSDEAKLYSERNVERVLHGKQPKDEYEHGGGGGEGEGEGDGSGDTAGLTSQRSKGKTQILANKVKAAGREDEGKVPAAVDFVASPRSAPGSHGANGKSLSEGAVRRMACEYLAKTRVASHKEELPRLFAKKYGTPLLCTGQERKVLHVQKLAGATEESAKKAEEGGEAKEGEEGEDEDEDEERSVYLYVGKDARPGFQYKMEDILANQKLHGEMVEVKTFQSLDKEAIRAVTWAPDCGVLMFPPFYSFPDIHFMARKDIRNFVRTGKEDRGTVMFVGGDLEVGVINYLFDFQIQPKYVAGPYYKNQRYVHEDSPFHELPDMVPEVGNVYGMWMPSLPPNSRSFYDSFGVSVACCIRYDLGRICFLAQDFLDVLKDEEAPWSELVEAMINYE